MPPAHLPAALIAIALLVAPCLAAAVSAAGEPARAVADGGRQGSAPDQVPPDATSGAWRSSLTATVTRIRELLQAGYARAPALVIVLGTVVVLPAVALASLLVQATARRRTRQAAVRAAELRAGDPEHVAETSNDVDMSLWPHEAWLTVEGGGAATLPLDSRLVRVGRHQDNDIRLPDTSVHRYHAVIERTSDTAFVITDLSGKDGNGVRVNGERQSQAQLVDGDVIELGRMRLKFESAPA